MEMENRMSHYMYIFHHIFSISAYFYVGSFSHLNIMWQMFRGVSVIQHLHNVETFIPVDLKETVATITRPYSFFLSLSYGSL